VGKGRDRRGRCEREILQHERDTNERTRKKGQMCTNDAELSERVIVRYIEREIEGRRGRWDATDRWPVSFVVPTRS